MKFALLLCVISVSALAQQKDEPKKDKLVKFSDYDSLDFDWKKEVFKQWDCLCPLLTPEVVQQMPHENSPYKWDKSKPLVIYLNSADLKFFKDKFIFIDSAQLKKKKPVSL